MPFRALAWALYSLIVAEPAAGVAVTIIAFLVLVPPTTVTNRREVVAIELLVNVLVSVPAEAVVRASVVTTPHWPLRVSAELAPVAVPAAPESPNP